MRALIGLILIVYLIGVGVELAPVINGKADESTASQLSASVARALPGALAWPAGVYRNVTRVVRDTGTGDSQSNNP
jgi:hypothetical protein